MDSQKFGTFISELRKERGWTQLELAQKLNVTADRFFKKGFLPHYRIAHFTIQGGKCEL